MNTTRLYNKFYKIFSNVKEKLKSKGFVIPKKNNNIIEVGKFKIIKEQDLTYTIIDRLNQICANNINLPQTAIIIANNLALGKRINNEILNFDREYGTHNFEDRYLKTLYLNLVKQNEWDRADILQSKRIRAREKAGIAKKYVLRHYSKLGII